MQKTNRPGFPVGLIVLLILLIGGAAAVTVLFQQNVTVTDAHDHDKDGKPDHGEGAHQ